MAERVLVAMSGGVDSSATALLLRRQGYELVGLFMRTGDHGNASEATPSRKKGCCSALDASDARRVADLLDMPFHALDFEEDFGRIVERFVDEYRAGRTPNPCVACNNWLKFGRLAEMADRLDCHWIATGHYAQIIRPHGADRAELHRGLDPAKDQSYVLHGIKPKVLERVLFPVGGLPKTQVREIAQEAGLPVFSKPDSVEICFVPDQDHVGLVRRLRPGQSIGGDIIDTAGNLLATHDGLERFTIGQRKGLGLGGGKPRYVLQLVPDQGTVVVGERDELPTQSVTSNDFSWLARIPATDEPLLAQCRYRQQPVGARVEVSSDNQVLISFSQAQGGISPGQSVVLYRGPRVLGGGTIDSSELGN